MGFDWGSDFGNDFDWGKGWWGGVLKKNVNKLMYWKFNVNKPYGVNAPESPRISVPKRQASFVFGLEPYTPLFLCPRKY